MLQRKLFLLLLILSIVFSFSLVTTNPTLAAGKKESAKETVNKATLDKKIDINKANKDELMMLPGIGEARADAIIKARKEKPFADLKDVEERKIGVGKKIIKDIEPYLTFK